jgi:hypothetical protein
MEKCDWCVKEIERHKAFGIGDSVFCSRKCMIEFYAKYTNTKTKDD